MQDNVYYKDGVARVLELLKNTFGDQFRAYFNGDAEPGESWYPCVMVAAQSANITTGASGTDDIDETVLIIISYNKKDDLGSGPEDQTTEFKLRKIVMGQDPTTMQYLPKTFMYALRKHYTLSGDVVLSNDITIDFAPNVRNKVIATQEAYITLNLTRIALVPSRD